MPIKIKREGQDGTLILKYLTMIDPTTGWYKIVQYNYNQVDKIEKVPKAYNNCNRVSSNQPPTD